MRVLHVIATAQRRGAEMFAADLVEALKAVSDVDQRVVAIRGSSDRPAFDPSPPTLGSERRTPGIRMDLGAVRRLRTIVREWEPDIVQAHGGEPLKYAVPAATGSRSRVVYRRIGEAPALLGRPARRAGHAMLARRADLIVAVAESLRREVVTLLRVAPGRVVTIPNAVDPLRLRPSKGREGARRSLGISPSAPVSLFLGALSEEKGPRDQVEMAEHILRAHPDAIHLMAGGGSLRTELERIARNRRLDGRLRFLGSRRDVADLLAMCDVLVMSSRTEGMPAAVIEAGMAGRPVAGYAVGGMGEVVMDGQTGILVEPSDLSALAKAVIWLLRHPDLRSAMGTAARERCQANYDIRTVAPRYLELYESLRRTTGGFRMRDRSG